VTGGIGKHPCASPDVMERQGPGSSAHALARSHLRYNPNDALRLISANRSRVSGQSFGGLGKRFLA